MLNTNDTIAALASSMGAAYRGILRVSGQDVCRVVSQLLHLPNGGTLHPLRARRYQTVFEQDDCTLPVDLYLWPTGRSFTGEPLAELHTVGSPPLLNLLLEAVYKTGVRPAERGEFTLRAFLAGRIDLVQAEAVLGVIDAANETELKTALSQLAGGVSQRIDELREELFLHLADLEAGLDFVEEDIEFVQRSVLMQQLQETEATVRRILAQADQRMQSTAQRRIVLAGLPNAGKSTLFNVLGQRAQALVSDVAGTTRDFLSTSVSLGRVVCELIDTAGWEPPRDGIEQLAGDLRLRQIEQADLIVWCHDAMIAGNPQHPSFTENLAQLAACRHINSAILEVITKAETFANSEEPRLMVSAKTGSGIDELRSQMATRLQGSKTAAEVIGTTAARCRDSLQHALQSLLDAQAAAQQQAGDEIIALELWQVLHHLGAIVGKVYTDDILDRIFSRFCIGK